MLIPMPAGTTTFSPSTRTSRWAWTWWSRNSLGCGLRPAATVSSMGFGGAGQETATGAADPDAGAEAGAEADAGADGDRDDAAVVLGTDATGEGAVEEPQPTSTMTAPATSPSRSVARSRIWFPSRTTAGVPAHDNRAAPSLRQVADHLRDVRQVAAELVIAAREQVHLRLRDHVRVQVRVQRRDLVVGQTVEEVDRDVGRQPRTEVGRQLELVGRPAAVTHERRREQHDGLQVDRRRLLREGVDEERPAHGMPDDDAPVVQAGDLAADHRPPGRGARVVLVGHPRVVDLEAVPELPTQAVDELVVPLVVGACAAALNEQDLHDG